MQIVANHLTPGELADEMNMKRREVIFKCMEMNVPIFNGRIDKTLFLTTMRQMGDSPGSRRRRDQGERLAVPPGGSKLPVLR